MNSRFKYIAAIGAALLLMLGVFLVVTGDRAGQRTAHPNAEKAKIAANKTLPKAQPNVPVVQAPTKAAETRQPLPNTDLRLDRAGSGEPLLPLPRINALAKLKQQIPGLTVDFDPITKSPKWIGSNLGLLTGPQASLASKDADAPVRQFIDAHREVFGHGSENLKATRRVTDYSTQKSNSRKVVWHQQLDGIDIFEAVFQANLTANSELINIGSHLMADPQAAADDNGRANLLAEPPVTVEQAIANAGQNVGEKTTVASVHPSGPPAAQPDRRQQFRAAMLTDAEAKLIWVPMDPVTLHLAWDVTISSRTRAEMYRVLVDAKTGGVLVRQSLTAYISDASYRIYKTENPSPFSPGHQTPSSLQPPLTDRVLLTTPALNTTASPNGWINDGGDLTTGNNTDAYTDTNADNVADLPRTQGPGRVFDFPMDLTQDPSTYKDASVTQLFYWSNFAHDRLYELGFTEAAGNFQTNNFGRGGIGNDPVNSEAQDGSGFDNANFSTPVDGGRGRMQMYNWSFATPDRDGSFEAEIVLHEYCHGLSNRLVGGPSVTITALSSAGMGEGWSDFYGLALTAEAADNVHGNWAPGGYARYLAGGWLTENFYYGIRRYSYSTDMLKNPHTFRDIDPTQVDWHTSLPRNPLSASTTDPTQVHYQGTVWCTILWDLRANLILKHGFVVGNERALLLVTEGMKLGPANPNFVQSRDGIIQATLVNFPADLGEVWTAFAKRGLGYGATAPASTTTTGLTESFAVPDSLSVDSRNGWNIRGDKGGPFTPVSQSLSLHNDGASALTWSVNANATWLSVSPAGGSLAPGATVAVTLTTQANNMVAGFYSTNLVFTNATSGFNQPIGVRLYVAASVVHSFDLSTNPGWTTTGEWAYGTPTGSGGTVSGGSGNADPTAGATGSKVFGVNLAGNPSTTVTGPHYLTTTPIDLAGFSDTRLRFRRWLNANTTSTTRLTVEVSTNGVSWREIYVNPGTTVLDNAWTLMDYDISSIADHQSAVQVRWSYQTLSTATAYSGWNLDDVQFLGEPTGQFTLNIASAVSEGAVPFTGTLNVSPPQAGPLTVNLSSSDPTAATVPASISLSAGQTSKIFTITPVNDTKVDGSQTTIITASAASVAAGSQSLIVTDDEAAVLTLSVPATVAEGQLLLSGSVKVNSPPTRDVQVTLAANNPSALAVPLTLTLPSGSIAPVNFSFAAPENAFAEGTKTVALTASVPGWVSSTKNVNVQDNETPGITLTGPDTAREGDIPQTFTATVNTVQAVDLTLNLTSSDVTQLTTPATLVIPAGQFSAGFDATIVDDAASDGIKTVTITAAKAGYPNATRVITIADNEVHHYTFATIPSPQKRNKPIAFAVTARDLNGLTITNHSGSLTLSTHTATGGVPFTSEGVSPFSNGTAAGSLVATAQATSMTIKATDGGGKLGTSNAFNVDPIAIDSFEWSGLPAGTVNVDTFFSGTATAKDDQGVTATSYNSPTVIEAYMIVSDHTIGSTGSATTTTNIYNTAAHDSRAQIIYTAAEMGGSARWIGSTIFSLATAGGGSMQNFTIRMKHTNRDTFDGASWEEGGWTTVFTSTSFSAGSTICVFNMPFYFNGTQNVIMDVSFDNASTATAGALRYVASTGNRVLSGTSDSLHGDPKTWTAATGPVPVLSKEVPTLTLNAARSFGPIPASLVTFSGGAATVQAFAPTSANGTLWLLATAPSGAFGFSNRIVIGATSGTVGSPVFVDGFEGGTLGSSWSIAGNSGATARTLVTANNTPKAGTYHLTMDTTSAGTGTFARNSPTLTLDLAGRTNVSLEWFAKGFLEDAHTPIYSPPLSTFDSNTNSDSVSISQDGNTWVEIASLAFPPSTYGATATIVPLDPIIQRLGWSYNSTFRIRFSQYDDQAIPNDGIAIDNVTVRANSPTAIALALNPTITEGTLNVPVTVTLPTAPLTDTVVTLTSNATARLTVSASVTVLANQTTATATISALQNQYADIGKDVTITASASGQGTSYHHIRVLDDEHPVLSLLMPPSIVEGGGTAFGTVSITPLISSSILVFLSSSNTAQATASPYTGINPGNPASFSITAVNDTILDGPQSVTITASALGVTGATGTIDVLDNESAQIVLTAPAPLREGGPSGVGTVTISAARTVETTVNLTSSDLTEATVSTTVVIPIGQTSANFSVVPIDDTLADGTQTVTLTASAAGLTTGTVSVQVQDNDPSLLEISTIGTPLVRNASIPVTIRAVDGSGLTASVFNGTATLSAKAGSTTLPVTPAAAITFTNGLWSGNISIGAAASGVILNATTPGGITGNSNLFNVVLGGAATKLVFAPISPSPVAGAPFLAQVFAADANGIKVNEINGPVTVELVLGAGGPTLTTVNLTLVNGAASSTFSVPGALPVLFFRAATASLTGQSSDFAVTSPPRLVYPLPEVLFVDDFEAASFKPQWTITGTNTHRTVITTAQVPNGGTRHMVMDSSVDFSASRNEATLTLNLAGKADVALSFWMKNLDDEYHGPPASPFLNGADFDGVAISADGISWYEVQPVIFPDSTYKQYTVNLSAQAAANGLSLTSAFKIRFNHYDDYTAPTDGFAFDDIRVVANSQSPPEPGQAVFQDDFETGLFKPEWLITGTASYRTIITGDQTPRGLFHLVMDATSTVSSRNEATLSLDLTGLQAVSLKFWMKENSDEDDIPATNPFTGGADFDGVAISANGLTWYEVQPLRGVSTGIYQQFTVDLDAAMATYGLTYNANFKIRFNHYDNLPWISGDGFAFDDISITGIPLNELSLTIPATLSEGGTSSAQFAITTARSVDTVITLQTNRLASLQLPATVTIPAGSTVSAPFNVTATNNSFLSGPLVADLLATAPGLRQTGAVVTILDNDQPASFTLILPDSLSEGGLINGSVTLAPVPLVDMVISLTAVPGFGLVFPATLTIPAGSVSAPFTVTRAENTAVAEAPSALFTAATGTVTASKTVLLPDNDTAVPLTLFFPSTISENAGSVPATVGFTAPTVAGRDIVVSLVSTAPGSLSVPATVTILAGASTAAFNATVTNNALQDGAHAVTITANATGLTGSSLNITVYDDELHHVAFDAVPSPQVALRSFYLILRGQTIDNSPALITGTASLSASSGGTPVPLNVSTSAPFISGVSTTPITIQSPVGNVIISATTSAGSLTASSNVFNVEIGPRLAISPKPLVVNVPAGEPPSTRSLALANAGTATVNWNAEVLYANFFGSSLPALLTSLNNNFAKINALIPNRYDFTEGVTGTSIGDGGGDMYDTGNFIDVGLTSPASYLTYSDNVIVANATKLGTGGQYFTRKYPGLFIFAADVAGLNHFQIAGELGADGSGSTNTTVLTSVRANATYKGFVKRVYGTSDPSVNHLIIIQDNGLTTHTASTNTNDDAHALNNLTGVTRIYYLLYASTSGGLISDGQTQALMEAFLDNLDSPAWLSMAPTAGSVAAGSSGEAVATLKTAALPMGAYQGTLRFTSNDASAPSQDVVVNLNVMPEVHHFAWSTVPSPQSANVPFPAAMTAIDSTGAPVTSFNGNANLVALGPSSLTTSGVGSVTNSYPFNGNAYDIRLQNIYLPAEVGIAGRLQSLAFDAISVPGILKNFTVRVKHTALASYSAGNSVWDNTGWTTVYNGTLPVSSSGWVVLPCSSLFDYNGASNLMVDVSFDNDTSVTGASCRSTTAAAARSLFASGFNTNGTPVLWQGANPAPSTSTSLQNIRFTTRPQASVSPAVVSFTNGTWLGNTSVQSGGASLALQATHAANSTVVGESNTFNVTTSGSLALAVAASGSEGAALSATVTASAAPASDLTVTLASSDTTEITAPATVTIPAGQTSATFNVALIDDNLLDGNVVATLSATAPSYNLTTTAITVTDNDTTVVTVSLPANVSEGDAVLPAGGTITLGAMATENLTLSLLSSDTTELTVPASVTVLAGQTSATFALTPVNDTVIDDDQPVTVTATLTGSTPGTALLTVADNEARTLSFSVNKDTLSESAPPSSGGIIQLSGTPLTPVVVTLTSSDLTELQSTTVTIPAGSILAPYTLTPVDDALHDGRQTVTFTASAASFTSAATSVFINDDEVHNFGIATVANQVRGKPFNITVTARDLNNATIEGYSGSPVLTAKNGNTALNLTPNYVTSFFNGVKLVPVTILDLADAAVLTVSSSPTAATGSSNAFIVGAASAADHFTWDSVPSLQSASAQAPFSTSLSARDSYENVATTYTTPAQVTAVTNYVVNTSKNFGETSDWYPFGGTFPQNRCQIIYPPVEVGATARTLRGLAFNMATPTLSSPAVTLTNFAIRLKHTTKANYSGAGNAVWDSTGWTTVYSGTVSMNQLGWQQFTFTTPFDYNGTDNLMVDITSNGANFANRIESIRDTALSSRLIYNFTSGSSAPATWSGTSPTPTVTTTLPDLRLYSYQPLPLAPTQTGAFTAGVWTGSFTLANPATGVRLIATNGNVTAVSAPFNIHALIPFPTLASEPLFTGGLGNTLDWSIDPAPAEVAVQRAATSAFTSPVEGSWTTNSSHTFSNLTDGSAYHYRARSRVLGSPVVAPESWTQTDSATFQTGAFNSTDATSVPTSVRLAMNTSTEAFEGASGSWMDTLFPTITSGGGYGKSANYSGLPVTTPKLPISNDADKEGSLINSGAHAWKAAFGSSNSSITAYIFPRNLKTQNLTGLLIRTTLSGTNTPIDGYRADLNYNASLANSVWLSISKITNGLATTLTPAGPATSFDPATEHFKMQIASLEHDLVAKLWKVQVVGGVVTETLVDTRTATDNNDNPSFGFMGMMVDQGSYFDDVTVAVNFTSSGTYTSALITPPTLSSWSNLTFNKFIPSSDTSLTVDVLDAGGALLAANVTSGTNLSTIPAITAQTSIRLRANLATSSASVSPELQDWTVSWIPANPYLYSAWSNTVTSTQDATPPLIDAPELSTTSNSAILAGTAQDPVSGVAAILVSAHNATTGNDFANWSIPVTNLVDGPNAFYVTAYDNAVPKNTSTVLTTIYRLTAPEVDSGKNGVTALLKHAFGIAPAAAENPFALLPVVSAQKDDITGQRFLTLDYRRRIQHNGLTYVVEISSDLTTWIPYSLDVIELSTTPTADGTTEVVRVRINPALTETDARFVRLRVGIQSPSE